VESVEGGGEGKARRALGYEHDIFSADY